MRFPLPLSVAVITVGEIFICFFGASYLTRIVPTSWTSTVSGLWLTVFVVPQLQSEYIGMWLTHHTLIWVAGPIGVVLILMAALLYRKQSM